MRSRGRAGWPREARGDRVARARSGDSASGSPQLVNSLAQVELPAEIEIAPEPADAPGTADWLRGAARRARPEGLEIRLPNEPIAPQGAPADSLARMVKLKESAGRFR